MHDSITIAMLSGGEPPSYLVYTTGRGFPPPIEGVPQALRGIATVFMLAILTGTIEVYNDQEFWYMHG